MLSCIFLSCQIKRSSPSTVPPKLGLGRVQTGDRHNLWQFCTKWLLAGLEPALSHMAPETFTIAPTEINIDQTMLLAERVQLQWTVTLVTHLHTSC